MLKLRIVGEMSAEGIADLFGQHPGHIRRSLRQVTAELRDAGFQAAEAE